MITGGTSGIGFAIAQRFLREGARKVVLVGRSHKRLLDAASRLSFNESGDVTSQVPEEDSRQDRDDVATSKNGAVVASSDRIGLLIGDVSDAGSWMRELEREMVCYSFSAWMVHGTP